MSRNLNEKHTNRFGVSENTTVEVSSSHPIKYRILYFLPKQRSLMRDYLFFGCFPRYGPSYRTNGSRISGGTIERKLKVLAPYFSGQ